MINVSSVLARSIRSGLTLAAALALIISPMAPAFADVSPSTDASMSSFAFTSPSASGTISGTDVSVSVPAGTDVTTLVPTIVLAAGATVNPVSGTPEDFTNPVHYLVTAEDGVTTQDYVVTVTVAAPVDTSLHVGPTETYHTIQAAIDAANAGDIIKVDAGTYQENVNVTKAVTLVSTDGAGSTSIVATDGNSTPLTFAAGTNGAVVDGFTITHDYTTAEKSAWNFNNNGVLFGQTSMNNTVKNSTITLNRNGVYINTAKNNSVIDNVITDNRTGLNLTGDFTGTTITGNTISDNWTEGFVTYGTNNPGIDLSSVTVSGNTFDQNWYEQVLVKSPLHTNTSTLTGTLDVTNNTFTDSPVTYTTSGDVSLDEPGFADQHPVELGGSATKPATALPTLRIYGTPAATLKYSPKTLMVGASESYQTIQAAVDAASAGDTINVDAGTYTENVTVNKSLTINGAQAGVDARGRSASESVVNGNGAASTFNVTANDVTIDGFTIEGAATDGAGVFSSNSGLTVVNNIITDNQIGVYPNCAGDCLIQNNQFTANNRAGAAGGAGIYLEHSDGLTVDGNDFTGHTLNSAVIFAATGADAHTDTVFTNNTIENNNSSNSMVYVVGMNGGTFTGNTIVQAGTTALKFAGADTDITVTGNTFAGNGVGVKVADDGFGYGDSSDIDIHTNDVSNNSIAGIANAGGYTDVVNASGNWWGDASGANDTVAADGSNPDTNNGTGSVVTGAVDYSDWCVLADCGTPATHHHASGHSGGSASSVTTTTTTGTGEGEVLGAATYNFTVDLHVGSTGADVSALQQMLIDAGYLHIAAPTGYYGPLTTAAVAAWQNANGISPAAGYFGPISRAKLLAVGVAGVPGLSDAQKAALLATLADILKQALAIQQELDDMK